MASSSTTRKLKRREPAVEQFWLLVGEQRGRVWLARTMLPSSGTATTVGFDGAAALAREELRGDVVGFLHTHPGSPAEPSRRDVATMRAWVSAFGKPLLCLIRGSDGLKAYRFDDDASNGELLEIAQEFKRGMIVAIDPA